MDGFSTARLMVRDLRAVLVDGRATTLLLEVSERQRKMLLAGGEVNVVRGRGGGG